MRTKSFLLSVCVACLSYTNICAQNVWHNNQGIASYLDSLVVEGRVVSSVGFPLANAVVKTDKSKSSFTTGWDGTFRLSLPMKGDVITVELEGKAPFRSEVKRAFKGVIIMDEQESSYMPYSEYVQQVAGNAESYYNAGLQYLSGDSVNSPDFQKAFACFFRAASMEHKDAPYQLGVMLEEGRGIKQDHIKAVYWYKRTTRHRAAYTRLGILYEEGQYMPQDYEEAAHFFRCAVAEGDSLTAKDHLQHLYEQGLAEEREIFPEADILAQYPGGGQACFKWLSQHIQYPEVAREKGIQGKVFIQFVINTEGTVSDAVVLRSPDSTLAEEALRVVQTMPQWKPAMRDGEPVRSRFNLPVLFRLQ